MGPALRVADYLYLIKRETCFDFAMIGCDTRVEIDQTVPKSTTEP